jgi:NAD(P)-dependent dehydrogenase (short-subunit alcohol dehydrogenase family)
MTGILEGRSIVITGASSGIGAEAARVFMREGASVTLGARSEDALRSLTDELSSAGGNAAYQVTDVSVAEDVDRLVDAVVARFGFIDGAFNNAGITQYGPLMDVDEADFDRIVAVNLKGVWLSLRAEVRAIVASGREGSIVNTSSVGGYRGSSGLGAYQATKHGVVGLTRTAAHDCGPFGIRVNVVAPGATETEMIRDWRARDPQAVDRRIGLIPLKRAAQPAEVADAAAWLISSMSGTINGALIPIDGGYSA